MSSDRSQNAPRSRGLWIGAAVFAGLALLVAAALVLLRHQDVHRQLAAQEEELAGLERRANAVADATEKLVQDHLLKTLRQAHPAVDTFANTEGGMVNVMFLHQAGSGSRGGHGFVVWNAERTRGVLVVSPLPDPGPDTAYRLVARALSGNASVTLATFRHETALPFALPQDLAPVRIEVVQASASHPDEAKLLLTSASVQP